MEPFEITTPDGASVTVTPDGAQLTVRVTVDRVTTGPWAEITLPLALSDKLGVALLSLGAVARAGERKPGAYGSEPWTCPSAYCPHLTHHPGCDGSPGWKADRDD